MPLSREGLRSVAVLGCLLLGGCITPNRSMEDDSAHPVGTNDPYAPAQEGPGLPAHTTINKAVPPPTMTTRQIREELWKIDAERHRGEAGRAITEYADRASISHTVEARFLAAAAIADDDEAWKAFNDLAAEYPKFYWAHAGMAAVYARWKIRDQGEREVNLLLDIDPDNVYAYTLRGNLYRNIGEFQMAERDYSTALRAEPWDADARFGLTMVRRAMGERTNFKEQLERALEDVPTHYDSAEQLALFLDDAGNKSAAEHAWARVEQLAPRNRTAHLALARLRGDADPEGAIRAYEKAAREAPLSKIEQESLTKLYHQTKRTDDEIKSLQTLALIDQKDPAPFHRIVEIALAKQDLLLEEDAYKSIQKINENDPYALIGLGKVAQRRSQFILALDYFRKAKAGGSVQAAREADRLSADCALPQRPLSGNGINSYYNVLARSLQKAYEKRLTDAPHLQGEMKLKVDLDEQGKVVTADVTENTPNDPWLAAHLYYAALDASPWRLKGSDPRHFTLTFDLPPPAH